MKRLIPFLILALTVTFADAGVRRYVRVGGTSSGTAATRATGWSHQWAWSSSNNTIQPGDTCLYIDDYGAFFVSDKDHGDIQRKSGSSGQPIIYRAEPGKHIRLYHDYTPGWAPAQIEGQYVWLWGFDIYVTDVVTPNEWPTVIINNHNIKIINCTIHDAKSIGITDYAYNYTEVCGNIIYYCGRQTNIDQFGYAGYIQNKTPSPEKIYRHNTIFSEWDLGWQFYGSDATEMDNITIDYNRLFNTGNLQPKPSEQFQPNIVIGAGEVTAKVVEDIRFRHNYGFYSASPGNGHYFSLGYQGSGIADWIVSDNVIVSQANSGLHFSEGYGSNLTFSNNMIIGPTQSTVTDHPGQGNVGYSNFAAAAAARSVDVYIDQNPYEPKRANVTIFNWDGSATVSFDPSTILDAGDEYEVRSATNFWGSALASGAWTSGNITITCSDITMATPYGSPAFPPRNPQPYFLPLVLVGPYDETAPNPQPPPAPVQTAATSVGSSGATLHWGASTGATSYRVDVATDASFTTLVIADTNVGNVTSSAITGLASGTQHWTRVRAVNADGTSSNSNTITFTTTSGAPNPPDDPIATSATNIYWNAFTANWGASSGATGHRLDISVDNFSTFVEGFNDLDVGNVTSYAVSGLQGSITYYYRVRAYNGDGFSAESNTISLTTLIAPPVPDLPRGRLLIHY
jgi:hypothetical protein